MITLNNGEVFNPVSISGGREYVQGQARDVISFAFPEADDISAIDRAFSADNCEKIVIFDGHGEYVHHGYVIRAALAKEPVIISPATDTAAEVTEQRITVKMAQRTYQESQIASLTETVDVLVMESLLG